MVGNDVFPGALPLVVDDPAEDVPLVLVDPADLELVARYSGGHTWRRGCLPVHPWGPRDQRRLGVRAAVDRLDQLL